MFGIMSFAEKEIPKAKFTGLDFQFLYDR